MDKNVFKKLIVNYKGGVIVGTFLLLVIIVPMLVIQLFYGHDFGFHWGRIDCLAAEIEAGNIPARLYHQGFNGYGYASPLFYGDLFLFIPALLILMGVPSLVAYKLFVILCICACVLVSYYCGKKMFGTRASALCFTFTYAISSYYAVDIAHRMALGEIQAFIFIPLAFLGLHSILLKDGKYWYYLPIGLFCVLMSHTLSAAMTTFFLLAYALLHASKLSIKKINVIVLCVVVFLLLSASFFLPMLEQMFSAKFIATRSVEAIEVGTLKSNSLSIRELFSLFNIVPFQSTERFIPQGIGYLPLFLLLFRILCLRNVKFCNGDKYFLVANVCLFMGSNLFPWGNETVIDCLGSIQFPWRILNFSMLFFAFAVVDYSGHINHYKQSRFAFFVCVLSVIAFGSAYIPRVCGYAYYRITDYNIKYYKRLHDRLYLPAGTNDLDMQYRGEVIITDGDDVLFSRTENGGVLVQIDTTRCVGSYIDVPLIMYKGYTAVFEDAAGDRQILPIGYGENNVLRVQLDDITTNGTITIEYTGTTIQRVSFWISVISFAVLIAVLLWNNKKRKHPVVLADGASTLQ